MEIQDKNNPKMIYLVDIWMELIPCRGSVVSHVNIHRIILLIKVDLCLVRPQGQCWSL